MDTLTKRLIACFDIKDGRVTKASKFQNNIDIGSPVGMAKELYDEGIDELIFYDIMASPQKRKIDIKVVQDIAKEIFVPFTVGGGIKTLDDMYDVLSAGAEKISIDSMAVRQPDLIAKGARAFGSQCIVLSTQVQFQGISDQFPSGYEVAIDGARVLTGMDAVEWAKKGADLGAGEICVNSIDNDGTHQGYDLNITKQIGEAVSIPVIASGGAGQPQHIVDVFTETKAYAAIISSMLYSPRIQNYPVRDIKDYLVRHQVPVRY